MLFSGIADVREWYDDAAGCFRIVVDVHNRVWGPLFGYGGSFNVEWRKVTEVPSHILPKPFSSAMAMLAERWTITCGRQRTLRPTRCSASAKSASSRTAKPPVGSEIARKLFNIAAR